MCTAATYKTKDFYFGRTLDYEFSYGEEIVVTPRNFPFSLRHEKALATHLAIIGMAHIEDGYPLYYDAANEKGLAMAGLNFVGNAVYGKKTDSGTCGGDIPIYNIAQFEFIPWVLSNCASVSDAKELVAKTNLVDTPFHEGLPVAQLHWIIADETGAITVEYRRDGLHILDNPVGILTNNPPFETQMFLLNNYKKLSPAEPENHFSEKIKLDNYSRGMGALGLPGDLSSASRFVRAAFTKLNSISGDTEAESVSQFFHILGSVSQTRGCCEVEPGKYEISIYTSCINATKGVYYYTTYDNHQISAVNLFRADLNEAELTRCPLIMTEQILLQN